MLVGEIMQTATACQIIDLYTTIDEIMRDGAPVLTKSTIDEIFNMGQYHEWSYQYVTQNDIDMDMVIEIPDRFQQLVFEMSTGF